VGHRVERHDTLLKVVSSVAANKIRSFLLNDKTPDTGCGLKVFSREVFLKLPNFDHMHRFLPALVIRAGGTVTSIPIKHRPRVYGKSNYGFFYRLWVGVNDIFGVMWLRSRGSIPVISPLRDECE
jgi:dolichol-phosphate mannosyltransferase